MKKMIFAVMALLLCTGITTKDCVNTKNLYLRRGTVIAIDEKSDAVTVEDGQGNLWEFLGTEYWHTGDKCELLMDNVNTTEIEDDIIVCTFYKAN